MKLHDIPWLLSGFPLFSEVSVSVAYEKQIHNHKDQSKTWTIALSDTITKVLLG